MHVTVTLHNKLLLVSHTLHVRRGEIRWDDIPSYSITACRGENNNHPTFTVAAITQRPRGAVWDKGNSCNTIPRLAVDSHLSTIFPLGSCMWERNISQGPTEQWKKALFFHTDNRNVPVQRDPLCPCMDGYPAEHTWLWLWLCPLDGIVTCPFGWRWTHSWDWRIGWWCWWKWHCFLCSPAPSGLRGNSGLRSQESGATT